MPAGHCPKGAHVCPVRSLPWQAGAGQDSAAWPTVGLGQQSALTAPVPAAHAAHALLYQLQVAAFGALYAGAAVMALLGRWA